MIGLDRITQSPDGRGGKPWSRNTGVSVGMMVGQVASGRTPADLLIDYPYLEPEDVTQSLRYAPWRAE